MIENGLGFQLVPWRSILDKRIGQHMAAAGSGINAYNYGTGNVTVTTGTISSITGATTGNQADGINANANDGGNVSHQWRQHHRRNRHLLWREPWRLHHH
jgi:hypothetical protein